MYTDRLTTLLFDGGLMLLCYIIILGLIFCDLQAGIRKARKRNEPLFSDGYKRTIQKIAQYFNMTFALSLIDIAQLALLMFLYHFYGRDIIMIPWFTLLALGYVGFVEIKSIWEPANIKEKKQQQEYRRAILALIREYGGIEKVMDALLKDQKKDDGTTSAADIDNENY